MEMSLLDQLKAVFAAVIPGQELVSDEAFDYVMGANMLRYEKVCEPLIQEHINSHILPIVDKKSARRARDGYSRIYLLNLNLPYTGIQRLCSELCRVIRKHGLTPTQAQLDLAAGRFNWQEEYESMITTNIL